MSNSTGKVLDKSDQTEDDHAETTVTEPADTEGNGTETSDTAASDTAARDPETRDTKDPESEPVATKAATAKRWSRQRLWALTRRSVPAVALLLIVGLAAATGYLGWQRHERNALDDASAAALRAATSYAVILTSVDTNSLDANFQAVLDGSTGEFRDAYTQSSTQLRQLLIDHKAVGRGVVLQSAVKSATRDEVVVLLFVDQTVTNTELPDPRIDRSRIVMTMREVDGRWKAAKVDIP